MAGMFAILESAQIPVYLTTGYGLSHVSTAMSAQGGLKMDASLSNRKAKTLSFQMQLISFNLIWSIQSHSTQIRIVPLLYLHLHSRSMVMFHPRLVTPAMQFNFYSTTP